MVRGRALNVSYNCLDRNLENGNANKTAIIFRYDGKVTSVTTRIFTIAHFR
jgi:acetyl-CoA synthetase